MEYKIWSFYPRTLTPSVFTTLVFVVVVHIFCLRPCLGQDPSGVRRVIGPSIYVRVFNTQCKNREVVLVDKAALDEATDITDRLDERCSAQPNCEVQVRSLCNGTCSASSQPSLNVTYWCLTVASRDCRQPSPCPSDGQSRLTTAEGYLASDTALQRPCGTPDCPWYVQVPPGQYIQVVLYDLSGAQKRQAPRGQRLHSETSSCIVVKERANPKEVHECITTGQPRQRVVYTTVSNNVELRLIPKQEKFILHYKAMGCPDIVPPYNSRMRRTGDRCEVDCPGSDLKWTLSCEGGAWVGADKLDKCPGRFYAPGALPDPQKTSSGPDTGSGSPSSSLPTSILIAAVVAITVIIAVLVLTTGFVCLKKHQYETKLGDPLLYGAPTSEFEFCTDFAPGRPGVVPKGVGTARSGARRSVELLGPMRDNTYAADRQLEMQPLHRPLPMIPGVDGRTGSWRPNDQKRIMVQLHQTGSGTMSIIPPYPTMMMRDGRLLPCNCGGTARTHASQHSVNNRPPSHLYFTLDPEVHAEEPATLGRSYPAIEQGGVGSNSNHTIPHAHQQRAVASGPTVVDQRSLTPSPPPPPPPPLEMHNDAAPLNLTNPSRAKHATQISESPVPLNLTPPNKKGSSSAHQNPNHDIRQWRQNPSVGVEAHS